MMYLGRSHCFTAAAATACNRGSKVLAAIGVPLHHRLPTVASQTQGSAICSASQERPCWVHVQGPLTCQRRAGEGTEIPRTRPHPVRLHSTEPTLPSR